METRNFLYKQHRLQQTNLWEVWPKCCYGSEEDDDDDEGFERYGEGTRVEKTLLRGLMRQTPSSQIRLRLQLVWGELICVCVCAAEVSVYNGTDRVHQPLITSALSSSTHTLTPRTCRCSYLSNSRDGERDTLSELIKLRLTAYYLCLSVRTWEAEMVSTHNALHNCLM